MPYFLKVLMSRDWTGSGQGWDLEPITISIKILYQNKKMIIRVFSNLCFDFLRLLPNQRIGQHAGAEGDSHIHQANDNRPPE